MLSGKTLLGVTARAVPSFNLAKSTCLHGTRPAHRFRREFDMRLHRHDTGGIGISRLVSSIRVCSQVSGRQGGGFRWPISIAPFKVYIIVPEGPDGTQTLPVAKKLIKLLEKENIVLVDDVVVDDRDQRIGWKLADAELVGDPILIILGNHGRPSHSVQVRHLISASHSKISVLPGPSSSSQEAAQLDLQPIVSYIIAEIDKLTPRVSYKNTLPLLSFLSYPICEEI
ncbi:hypothetical protein PCANC_18045 [Puccinia coronata f. sp. avenae]|uniref:Anticodon-binding domain-containing protein n=1 Tax=Puccinia coronata f. sp. avenae TaxID=200324 RepID=A0A2N5SS12_9BASI|nr:hypothetical protein PCANC_18045 [Puccinia coronata f. sp. avenae]